MNIKVGQVLKFKGTKDTRVVLAVLEGCALLSGVNDHDVTGGWETFNEITYNYELPKERWKPKEDETFYFISSELDIVPICYEPILLTHALQVKTDNCFKTGDEALVALEKIKKILAE